MAFAKPWREGPPTLEDLDERCKRLTRAMYDGRQLYLELVTEVAAARSRIRELEYQLGIPLGGKRASSAQQEQVIPNQIVRFPKTIRFFGLGWWCVGGGDTLVAYLFGAHFASQAKRLRKSTVNNTKPTGMHLGETLLATIRKPKVPKKSPNGEPLKDVAAQISTANAPKEVATQISTASAPKEVATQISTASAPRATNRKLLRTFSSTNLEIGPEIPESWRRPVATPVVNLRESSPPKKSQKVGDGPDDSQLLPDTLVDSQPYDDSQQQTPNHDVQPVPCCPDTQPPLDEDNTSGSQLDTFALMVANGVSLELGSSQRDSQPNTLTPAEWYATGTQLRVQYGDTVLYPSDGDAHLSLPL